MHLNHRETDGLHPHNSPQIRHGVPETLNLNSTQLVVHREVCQVHVAGGFRGPIRGHTAERSPVNQRGGGHRFPRRYFRHIPDRPPL